MGDVINLKEWKEKKLSESRAKFDALLEKRSDEPLDVAFEMAQIMYDSRKDRLAEEQEILTEALEDLDDAMKILEEASTKAVEEAEKHT